MFSVRYEVFGDVESRKEAYRFTRKGEDII